VTAVIEANDLGKRYGRKWALRHCCLSIPEGKVTGLVGPNGAVKTTLLSLAVGLLAPTCGSITVLGGQPGDGPAQLGKVGFIAQDTPAYAGLSVGRHLLMGAYLNANWDHELARSRIDRLGLDPRQKAGTLSGGQRAQLALTMAGPRRHRLRDLVHVLGARQAGADVQELADSGLARQVPDGAPQEGPVLADRRAHRGPALHGFKPGFPVDGEMVRAAQVEVVDPGRMRCRGVEFRRHKLARFRPTAPI